MNFSNNNMVSFEVILSDLLQNVDDVEFKKFNSGIYKFIIQAGLEQLSLQTQALTIEKDYAMPSTLSLSIPQGCFNLQEIYVYNGTCCNKSTAKNLWWKRNYRTKGLTEGYVTRAMKDTQDPFIQPFPSVDEVFFYGIENGMVYLSPSCAGYSRVNLVFNGLQTNYGDIPIIPIQFRKALVDYCTVEVLKKLKARDPRTYAVAYRDAYTELYDKNNGSWCQAKIWARTLDANARQALLEYLSKANEA